LIKNEYNGREIDMISYINDIKIEAAVLLKIPFNTVEEDNNIHHYTCKILRHNGVISILDVTETDMLHNIPAVSMSPDAIHNRSLHKALEEFRPGVHHERI